MEEEAEYPENLQNWKFGNDKDYKFDTRHVSDDRCVNASGSKSDPISTMRSHRNRNLSQDFPEVNRSQNHNSRFEPQSSLVQDVHEIRKPGCSFVSSERPIKSLVSTQRIISQPEEEDEPTDVLVWSSTSKNPNNGSIPQRHRSLSNTNEFQLSSNNLGKSSLFPRSKSQESRSMKLLDSQNASFCDETGSEYENQLFAVTEQLQMIKTTQDSILSELSSDISTLQYENIHLKNQNEHLTVQNSHLLQVITDLSNQVEMMRQVFRTRGWPLHQGDPRNRKTTDSIDTLNHEVSKPVQHNKPHERRNRNNPSCSKSKFETIPLDDSSSIGQNARTGHHAGPGDDQVSILANRSRDRSVPKSRQKSNSKPKPNAGKEKGGCFRGLFKRKNKKLPRRTNGENGLS